MTKTGTVGAALAALLCIAAAGPAFAEDDVTLAIPALSLSFSSSYIAQDLGYWSKAGLNVKLVDIPGIGATNAVLAGSVDFANASGPTAIRAPARGQKLLSIAAIADRMVIETVLSKNAAEAAGIDNSTEPVKKIQALRGKKMAVETVNSIVHGYLRYVARKGGIDPERDIAVTPMQPPAMLAALKTGAIDGFTMSMPWPLLPVHEGTAVRISSGPKGDAPELNPFAFTVIVAKPETCEKRPTVCQRLVAGIGQAFAFMHDSPRDSIAILTKRLPAMDPAIFAEGFELQRVSTPKTPHIEEASLTKAQDFMLATNMMTPEEKLASFKDIYTNKFADK
jgi:ABC-type nitrate/sulfonate/bicarbonate transport system substrate-binding protein